MPSTMPVLCYFPPAWCFWLLSSSSSPIMPFSFPGSWQTCTLPIIFHELYTISHVKLHCKFILSFLMSSQSPSSSLTESQTHKPRWFSTTFNYISDLPPFLPLLLFLPDFFILPKKHKQHKSWPSFLTSASICIFPLLLQILHYFLSQLLTFLLCSLPHTLSTWPSEPVLFHLFTSFVASQSLSLTLLNLTLYFDFPLTVQYALDASVLENFTFDLYFLFKYSLNSLIHFILNSSNSLFTIKNL